MAAHLKQLHRQPGSFGAAPSPAWLRRWTLAFATGGLLLLALLVGLDAAAPGGRGFLVITPANIDSICYFSTAHSLLFDRDFDLSNELRVMMPPDSPISHGARAWVAVQPSSGLPGSPYAIGYSLLTIPFLAAGTLVDALTGAPANGYGRNAIAFFVSANIVFLTLGLVLLFRWLAELGLRWGQDPRRISAWAAACSALVVPCTALGYYAFTVMSHTASFLATVLFLWVWWRRRDSEEIFPWLLVGASAGLMALCRWQDALFLSIPAVYELRRNLLRDAFHRRRWWLSRAAALAAFLAIFFPQMLQWRILYGRWWTVPQGPQFLDWPPSRVLHVLFSSHNGLFFTTPATLTGVVGLFLGLRKDTRVIGGFVVALALQILLIGSLPTHWSGMAFAMRLLISSTPLLAAGCLFLVLHSGRTGRAAILGWICAGGLFTFLTAVQWRYEFVPRRGPLTFQEAFGDKLRLVDAYRRYQAVERLKQDGELKNPEAAARALEEVIARFGENRVLLTRLRAFYERAGDLNGLKQTQARLDRLNRKELF